MGVCGRAGDRDASRGLVLQSYPGLGYAGTCDCTIVFIQISKNEELRWPGEQ